MTKAEIIETLTAKYPYFSAELIGAWIDKWTAAGEDLETTYNLLRLAFGVSFRELETFTAQEVISVFYKESEFMSIMRTIRDEFMVITARKLKNEHTRKGQ